MKAKLNLLVAATAVGIASLATGAMALPLTNLYFSQAAGWVNPTTDGNTTTGFFSDQTFLMQGAALPSGPYPAATFAGMQWTSGLTSSIAINSFSDNGTTTPISPSSTVPANGDTNGDGFWNPGELWIITQLVQTNNAIGGSAPNPMWIADALANLNIYGNAAHTQLLLADPNSATRISFFETPNQTGCSGSPHPLGTTCDDIYNVLSASLAPIQFTNLGFLYTVSFSLIPGPSTNNGSPAGTTLVCSSASDPGCSANGGAGTIPAGTLRVFTPEYQPGTSSLFVGMSWSAEPIPAPEPSILALLAAGLMGLGWTARRRKAANA